MSARLSVPGGMVPPWIAASCRQATPSFQHSWRFESLGFVVEVRGRSVYARRGQDEYGADDPVALLGLIQLVELRSWGWAAE